MAESEILRMEVRACMCVCECVYAHSCSWVLEQCPMLQQRAIQLLWKGGLPTAADSW